MASVSHFSLFLPAASARQLRCLVGLNLMERLMHTGAPHA
nr:MAG TPA: hypothetical protein [Caudoviricetes sp.]